MITHNKNCISELKASVSSNFKALTAFPLKPGVREVNEEIRQKSKLRSGDTRKS